MTGNSTTTNQNWSSINDPQQTCNTLREAATDNSVPEIYRQALSQAAFILNEPSVRDAIASQLQSVRSQSAGAGSTGNVSGGNTGATGNTSGQQNQSTYPGSSRGT